MKGFIAKITTIACLGGTALAGGCVRYQNLVDPCSHQRYAYAARQEVHRAFTPQVQNGHVLDQTLWNHHFEFDEVHQVGTDKLTLAGQERLSILTRRRPCPDTVLFLQTAYDLPYDPAKPEAFAQLRSEMDRNRVLAIQKFLTAQTAGRPLPFEVVVHDPSKPDLGAEPTRNSVVAPRGFYHGHIGILPRTQGGVTGQTTFGVTQSGGGQ